MGTGVLPTYEHDVFLSYNHVDHDWVHELAVRIESEQWDGRPLKVFFDEWDIQPFLMVNFQRL